MKIKYSVDFFNELKDCLVKDDPEKFNHICTEEKLSAVQVLDDEGFTLTHYATAFGACKILESILKSEKESLYVRNVKFVALMHMAKDIKTLEVLLDSGADINCVESYGNTALHYAVWHKRLDMVKFLLQKGADSNISNKYELKAIFLAKSKEIIEILISYVSDINTADHHGNTLLHKAAFLGSYELIEYLIENVSNVNAINKSGYTPLYIAVANGNSTIIELFLKNSYTIEAAYSPGGSTVLEVILIHNQVIKNKFEAIEYLLKKGNFPINARINVTEKLPTIFTLLKNELSEEDFVKAYLMLIDNDIKINHYKSFTNFKFTSKLETVYVKAAIIDAVFNKENLDQVTIEFLISNPDAECNKILVNRFNSKMKFAKLDFGESFEFYKFFITHYSMLETTPLYDKLVKGIFENSIMSDPENLTLIDYDFEGEHNFPRQTSHNILPQDANSHQNPIIDRHNNILSTAGTQNYIDSLGDRLYPILGEAETEDIPN